MTSADLLRSLGLEAHLPAFEANAVDADTLTGLTDADLKELGVVKLGERKRILAAIASRQTGVAPTAEAAGAEGPLAGREAEWPTPVAVPLREYAGEEHPVAKLWAACDTVEMTLRLLVIAQMGAQARGGVLPETLSRQVAEIIEAPTLGGWFVAAQALAGDEGPEPVWIRGALRDLLYGPVKPGTPETSFLALRNRLAHGGGLTRSEAARLLALWRPRFESAFAGAGFLAEWELLGRDEQGQWRRLRGLAEGEPASAPAAAGEIEQDAVWLRRGSRLDLLWPLALFGKPSAGTSSGVRAAAEVKPQIYSRKEAVRLAYTPVGLDGMAQSESGVSALLAFEALFQSARRAAPAACKVAGFEPELRKDAAQMVGRQRELEQVRAEIQAVPQGVLWLSGAAGMGKSFLMAKVATSLAEETTGTRTRVLAYRFRSGDRARCSRESLAQFVVERLQAEGLLKPVFEDKPEAKAADRLNHALGLIADDVRVILLLDGLDEVQRRDETFAEEVALGVRVPRLVCCCAGRPEPAIETAMRRLGGRVFFAEGLPPMREEDIRGMLLDRIGALRKRLLAQDREKGDAVLNPFIERVARCAAGLPLYVKYVVGDVLGGRYRVLDGEENLPDGLHAYHEELLRRLGVGDLQAVVTPLAATLACAYEPLSGEQLQAILLHRRLVQSEGGADLVARGLAALAAMVTAAPTPEGTAGYALFHQSLRDHILVSPQMTQSVRTARAALADLSGQAEVPSVLGAYFVRNAVRHLLADNRHADAERRLLDLEYLEQMDKAGVPWTSVYRWWMQLGGEERAKGYVAVVEAALQGELTPEVTARCFVVLNLFSDAVWLDSGIRLARIVTELLERELGADQEETLSSVLNLANLLRNRGDYACAYELHRRVLQARERTLGPEHPDTLHSVLNLANVLFEKGDHAGAESLYRRALAASERVLGPEHSDTLRCVNNFAMLLSERGDYVLAKELHQRAITGYEANLGPSHPSTLDALSNLAISLSRKGDNAAAGPIFLRALELHETVLGPEHPGTLAKMNNLAVVLMEEGNYDGAEELQRRALAGREVVLGSTHPETLASANNLANLLRARGDYAGSEALCRVALERYENTLGYDHLSTLNCVDTFANLLAAKGDYVGAEILGRRALAGREAALGPNHLETCESIETLLHILRAKSDFSEADFLSRRLLAIKESALGPGHSQSIRIALDLAEMLRSSAHLPKALELLRDQAARSEYCMTRARYNLACYECLSGNHAEAQRLIADELAACPEKRSQALADDDLAAIRDFIRDLPSSPPIP